MPQSHAHLAAIIQYVPSEIRWGLVLAVQMPSQYTARVVLNASVTSPVATQLCVIRIAIGLDWKKGDNTC